MRKQIVVLTGAGISAESGLKTFRNSDGLWMGYNIEDVATPRAFSRNPKMVLDFYNMRRREVTSVYPNDAHRCLAKLEEHYNVIIVTQNIDDLHERAGSKNVCHLHGEIFSMRSSLNEAIKSGIKGDINLNDLAPDGGQWRPDIVWFEEPVPMIDHAASLMKHADIFILIGTSLQVYPAAGLLQYLPDGIPIYIIDKKIPDVCVHPDMILIEMPATEGMKKLMSILMSGADAAGS